MKKVILLVLMLTFAFSKTISGQTTITIADISYEHYFQKYYDPDVEYSELQNIHCGRIGFLGYAFLLGRDQNYSIEWMPLSFMASSNEKYNVCFLNFTLRKELGRFSPILYMRIFDLEPYIHKTTHKIYSIIHHSLSAGFEFYLTNYSILAAYAGINYEMPGVLNDNSGKLSPFFGIGYKLEVEFDWDKH